MTSEIVIGTITFTATLVWGYILFWIGQKKRNTALFYALLYGPIVLGGLMALIAGHISYSIANIWSFVLMAAIIAEKAVWGITLKHASGEDKLMWFYIVMLVPLFGWIIYWVTKVR